MAKQTRRSNTTIIGGKPGFRKHAPPAAPRRHRPHLEPPKSTTCRGCGQELPKLMLIPGGGLKRKIAAGIIKNQPTSIDAPLAHVTQHFATFDVEYDCHTYVGCRNAAYELVWEEYKDRPGAIAR